MRHYALVRAASRLFSTLGKFRGSPARASARVPARHARVRAPLLTCVLLVLVSASAQNKTVFLSHYAAQDVAPSADPDSAFWKGIAGVVIDHSVLGPEMAQFRAQVRSRWTKGYVYFLFAGQYERLTLKPDPDLKNETYRLWEKDCFEVYLGADFEHTNRYRGTLRLVKD